MAVDALDLSDKTRILVVCSSHSVRSPLAHLLLQHYLPDDRIVESAGVESLDTHPAVENVLADIGISDVPDLGDRTLDDVTLTDYDVIIALSHSAVHALEMAGGDLNVVHWDVPEPPTVGEVPYEEMINAIKRIRDAIINKINVHFISKPAS